MDKDTQTDLHEEELIIVSSRQETITKHFACATLPTLRSVLFVNLCCERTNLINTPVTGSLELQSWQGRFQLFAIGSRHLVC